MNESRTYKASRNVVTGFIGKLFLMAVAFATKTVFVRILGSEYNGVSGLYSNILSILALSELGVGNVLNYSLYSALRNNDNNKVIALVKYFKKIYLGIAAAVGTFGVLLIPFLPLILRTSLPKDQLILYYILYLANSVASYFVVYKTTVIIADQNNYISVICDTIFTFLMYALQIIYLLIQRSFLGYLIIQVLCTFGRNIILHAIANKRYPYLKHINKSNSLISNEERTDIVENIKSTFLYKVSVVLLNNTDNILISILVGTVFVGYYSNYLMIVTYLNSFITIFITGITASLGNLNASNDSKTSYRMFSILSFIFSLIGTTFACGYYNCIQPFIPIWIGQEHLMPLSWVIVIVVNQYLTIIMNPIWMFRETMGLFKQVKYLMITTAFLNLVLSIVLGKIWGVPGILAATFISKLLSPILV